MNEYMVPVPVTVGQTLYTNTARSGFYLRQKDKPHPLKVAFVGLNEKGGFFNAVYMNDKKGGMVGFDFEEIGKNVFYTKEDAIHMHATSEGLMHENTIPDEMSRD